MKFSFAVVASVMAFALAASAAPAPQAAPATSPNVKTNPVGGDGGDAFDDLNKIPSPVAVLSYTIRAAARIDNVAVTVTGANGNLTLANGGGGGDPTTFTMQPGEFVTKMDVSIDEQAGSQRVFGLTMTTNQGNAQTFGQEGGNKLVQNAPQAGFGLVGFHGSAGEGIDSLGGIWGPVAAAI